MEFKAISWQALEHTHTQKSGDWYWIVWIIAISATVLLCFFGNYLLAVIIMLGAFTASLHAHRGPEMMFCEISPRGVVINNRLYPFPNLDSFWIDKLTVTPKILFKSNKSLASFIIMPLGDADEDIVRDFLLNYLPEVEHTEPALQKLLEHLGF